MLTGRVVTLILGTLSRETDLSLAVARVTGRAISSPLPIEDDDPTGSIFFDFLM